ncbi:hypothetical protein FOA52_013435 [Chlamydomonas sp. UWO 241]|nr:hypothetical protein FOA52_013435 [Chlamydomonas sp. UWO 241]
MAKAMKMCEVPYNTDALTALMEAMDNDGSGEVSWDKWHDFMAYLVHGGQDLLGADLALPTGISLPLPAMIDAMRRRHVTAGLMAGGDRRRSSILVAEGYVASAKDVTPDDMRIAREGHMEQLRRSLARATALKNGGSAATPAGTSDSPRGSRAPSRRASTTGTGQMPGSDGAASPRYLRGTFGPMLGGDGASALAPPRAARGVPAGEGGGAPALARRESGVSFADAARGGAGSAAAAALAAMEGAPAPPPGAAPPTADAAATAASEGGPRQPPVPTAGGPAARGSGAPPRFSLNLPTAPVDGAPPRSPLNVSSAPANGGPPCFSVPLPPSAGMAAVPCSLGSLPTPGAPPQPSPRGSLGLPPGVALSPLPSPRGSLGVGHSPLRPPTHDAGGSDAAAATAGGLTAAVASRFAPLQGVGGRGGSVGGGAQGGGTHEARGRGLDGYEGAPCGGGGGAAGPHSHGLQAPPQTRMYDDDVREDLRAELSSAAGLAGARARAVAPVEVSPSGSQDSSKFKSPWWRYRPMPVLVTDARPSTAGPRSGGPQPHSSPSSPAGSDAAAGTRPGTALVARMFLAGRESRAHSTGGGGHACTSVSLWAPSPRANPAAAAAARATCSADARGATPPAAAAVVTQSSPRRSMSLAVAPLRTPLRRERSPGAPPSPGSPSGSPRAPLGAAAPRALTCTASAQQQQQQQQHHHHQHHQHHHNHHQQQPRQHQHPQHQQPQHQQQPHQQQRGPGSLPDGFPAPEGPQQVILVSAPRQAGPAIAFKPPPSAAFKQPPGGPAGAPMHVSMLLVGRST